MTDKTAAELIGDMVRNYREIQKQSTNSKYLSSLIETHWNIVKEMEEWYEERMDYEG